jgi:hypothetical protein
MAGIEQPLQQQLDDSRLVMDLEAPKRSSSWLLSNVRGLRQASGELRAYLAANRPTFVALTETHLKGDAINTLVPANKYKTVARLDRSKHGGGLYIGAQQHLLIDKLDLAKYNTVKSAEMVGVRYEHVEYILCYTSKSSLAIKLLMAIQRYMLDNPNNQVVLLGDFNVHNQDWIVSSSTDPAGVEAQDMCEMFGLTQLVDFATREGNALDLVMSSIPGIAQPVLPMGSSDHKSVGITFETSGAPPPSPESPSVYDWSSAPWGHIAGFIKRALFKWDPTTCESVDAAERHLSCIMQQAIDKYVKVKKMTIRLSSPWWNRTCIKKLLYKCRMFDKFEKGLVSAGIYKCAVRVCRKVQKKAFARYQSVLKEKLDSTVPSDKAFWSLAKEIAGVTQERSASCPSVDALADHFAKKMSNGKGCEAQGGVVSGHAPKVLDGWKVRFKVVLKTLRRLDHTKSTHGVGPRFLKKCCKVLAAPVTKLFRFIVNRATFPSKWKLGRVTPLHKRKAVSDPANYRPVTVLNNLESVFEGALELQLQQWICKFIPQEQYGFLTDCGTIDYGARLLFSMLSCREQRKEGILVILDVKGAFDRCFWSKILVRLRVAGMRGRALRLMKDYLRDRFIQVVCNGDASSERPIYSGVPQGARWSPLLWDFDISELASVVSSSAELGCYADDMWLWYEIDDHNRSTITQVVNQDLESLLVWAEDNKTTFEPDKTAMLVVSGPRAATRFDPTGIVMGGFAVEQVEEVKVTGFIFDSGLLMSSHINMVAKKARQRVGALRNLRPYLDAQNMKAMYESFVRSILEYGNVLYMGAAESHLAKLDQIQSSVEKLGGFKCVPLSVRREIAAVKLALKLLDQDCRRDLNRFAPILIDGQSFNHGHDTMHKLQGIQLQPVSFHKYPLNIFLRSYLGSIHVIWSKLPQELIERGEQYGWRKISSKCKQHLLSLSSMRSIMLY